MKQNKTDYLSLSQGIVVKDRKSDKTKMTVFVIMSFSDNPILESYYEEAILPTIIKHGLKPVRIDHEKFTGKISDKIIEGINNSKFVLADLTEDRPNCYFEAGYAVAKDKRIIFQRLHAPQYEPKFHFDVQDYRHIVYKKISDLRDKLSAAIESLLSE